MSGRSNSQVRYGAAFHEAGHGVVAFLLGLEFGDIRVMPQEGPPLFEEFAGWTSMPAPIETLHEAEDHIVVLYAGEAATRAAWRLGLLDAELLGTKDVEPTLDDLIAGPNDAGPVAKAIYGGWNDKIGRDTDQVDANQLARDWTSSDLEAATLLAYARARAASLVEQERTLRLIGNVAEVLLADGVMTGERAADLLPRWNAIFKPTITKEARDGN